MFKKTITLGLAGLLAATLSVGSATAEHHEKAKAPKKEHQDHGHHTGHDKHPDHGKDPGKGKKGDHRGMDHEGHEGHEKAPKAGKQKD